MPEHIKAFLLASSLAFGIPTFMEEAAPSPRWLRQLELSDAQRDEIFRIFRD
jgi:hypothetical protein